MEDIGQDLDMAIDSSSGADEGYANPSEGQVNSPYDWTSLGFDTTSDKRFGEMWKHPKDLYQSYKSLEPQFQKSQSELKEHQRQVQEYKTVANEYGQVKQYIQAIEGHPEFKQKFAGLIDDFNKFNITKKYGGDLPPQVLEKLNKLDEIERKINGQEQEAQKQMNAKLIDDSLSDIDKFAKEQGIEYDKVEFLKACQQKNVPLDKDLLTAFFYKSALPMILNSTKTNTQKSVLENIKQNRINTSVSSTKNQSKAREINSFADFARELHSINSR